LDHPHRCKRAVAFTSVSKLEPPASGQVSKLDRTWRTGVDDSRNAWVSKSRCQESVSRMGVQDAVQNLKSLSGGMSVQNPERHRGCPTLASGHVGAHDSRPRLACAEATRTASGHMGVQESPRRPGTGVGTHGCPRILLWVSKTRRESQWVSKTPRRRVQDSATPRQRQLRDCQPRGPRRERGWQSSEVGCTDHRGSRPSFVSNFEEQDRREV